MWSGDDKEGNFDDPIDGGIYLRSSGNFGSSVFDACLDPIELELYICDQCLIEKSGRIYQVNKNSKKIEIFEDILYKE